MRLSITMAVMAALLLVSPAVAQDDLEAREAAARALLGPVSAETGQEAIAELRAMFQTPGFSAAERAALESAFDAETPALIRNVEDAVVTAVARHVPLADIRADADAGSPEWMAAKVEASALSEDIAVGVLSRIAERGCTVDTQPSERCVGMLERARLLRAGQSRSE